METELVVIIAAGLATALGIFMVKGRTRREFNAHDQMAAANGLKPVISPANEVLGLGLQNLSVAGDERVLFHRLHRPGSPHEIFDYRSWSSTPESTGRPYDRTCALVELVSPVPSVRIAESRPWRRAGDPKPEKVVTGVDILDGRFWVTGDPAFIQGSVHAEATKIVSLFDRMPEAELELHSSHLLGTSHLLVTHPVSFPIERRLELLEWGHEFAASLGLNVAR